LGIATLFSHRTFLSSSFDPHLFSLNFSNGRSGPEGVSQLGKFNVFICSSNSVAGDRSEADQDADLVLVLGGLGRGEGVTLQSQIELDGNKVSQNIENN
jgi:hypothetical protein